MPMYSEYRGRCKERILFFLCQIDYAVELVGKFSPDGQSITWGSNGIKFCTYSWQGDTDIPVFEFHNRWKHINSVITVLMKEMVDDQTPKILDHGLVD